MVSIKKKENSKWVSETYHVDLM